MAIKICLDAGHYGKCNRSPAVHAYYESDMVWKLHLLLKAELESYGFEVRQTRKEKDKNLSVYERGTASKGSDLFLSLHSNAVGNEVNESVDYPVVYVQLDGKGDALGNKLAECIESVMGTKQDGRINKRRGDNGEYYGVLRGAAAVGTVGMILEHSFHTNTRMTNWLLQDSNLAKLADAEAKVIAEYYGMTKKEETKEITESAADDAVLYRVQVGAYSVKANADAQQKKVAAAGFDTYMVKADGMYKIQVGAYREQKNAAAMFAKLKAAGFDAFVTTKGGDAVANTEKQKSIDELARECIRGDWGDGAERKARLAAAGYDYEAVQRRVNELV